MSIEKAKVDFFDKKGGLALYRPECIPVQVDDVSPVSAGSVSKGSLVLCRDIKINLLSSYWVIPHGPLFKTDE